MQEPPGTGERTRFQTAPTGERTLLFDRTNANARTPVGAVFNHARVRGRFYLIGQTQMQEPR